MVAPATNDFFTQDELIGIYEKAGSAEQSALTAAAKALYPDRMAAEEPPMLKVEKGIHGRWFVIGDEDPVQPQYTVKSGRCSWIGILKDGRALKY